MFQIYADMIHVATRTERSEHPLHRRPLPDPVTRCAPDRRRGLLRRILG